MSGKKIIKRTLSEELKRLSEFYAVIVITGPRQSGKTTLSKMEFPDYHYVNMENISLRHQIMESPMAFLEQHQKGLVIDEVQNVPELFSYIQVVADNNENSRFILTGSSNFSLLEKVTQSLAGRLAILTLLPLSLQEIGNLKDKSTNQLIFWGGYPAVWGKKIPVQDVTQNYYNTYIERDVRQILNVKNLNAFQTFIRLCAGRVGTEFNASALSNEIGVSVPTIKEWLSVLEASYVVFRLHPFSRNIGKRLIKTPKIYFYDTALVCYLLGIENEEQLSTHPLRGAIFENLMVLDFFKNKFNKGKIPHFYFYRDKSQIEIDLLEEKGIHLLAYEIKSATSFTKNFANNIKYLKNILGNTILSTTIIFDGNESIISNENSIVNFRDIKFD